MKDLVMKMDDSGQVYYQLDYDVIVSLGRRDLQAELCWITRVSYSSTLYIRYLI